MKVFNPLFFLAAEEVKSNTTIPSNSFFMFLLSAKFFDRVQGIVMTEDFDPTSPSIFDRTLTICK